jgi:hypothetical protein
LWVGQIEFLSPVWLGGVGEEVAYGGDPK